MDKMKHQNIAFAPPWKNTLFTEKSTVAPHHWKKIFPTTVVRPIFPWMQLRVKQGRLFAYQTKRVYRRHELSKKNKEYVTASFFHSPSPFSGPRPVIVFCKLLACPNFLSFARNDSIAITLKSLSLSIKLTGTALIFPTASTLLCFLLPFGLFEQLSVLVLGKQCRTNIALQ